MKLRGAKEIGMNAEHIKLPRLVRISKLKEKICLLRKILTDGFPARPLLEERETLLPQVIAIFG